MKVVVHHIDVEAAHALDPAGLLLVMTQAGEGWRQAAQRLWSQGLYAPVAAVDAPAGSPGDVLNAAFRLTQTIEEAWTEDPRAGALVERPRSSMMGDIFIVEGEAYLAAVVGFARLELPKPPKSGS